MKHTTSLTGSLSTITGITQNRLARLLGISQSLLSRYEAGARSLPATAMLQLARMYKIANAGQEDLPATVTPADMDVLRRHADDLRFRAAQLQRKLDGIRQQQQQATALTALLQHMQHDGQLTTEKQQRLAGELEYEASKKLQRHNWLVQQQLEAAAAAYAYQAGLCEAAVAANQ